jgi:predicted HD phosphohydrolase
MNLTIEEIVTIFQTNRLRYWDDLAKVVGLSTPDLNHFIPVITNCIQK